MKDDIVPFTQEVQHVKDYLALQKQRFGEQLQYELHIQPELEDMFVPKMILQPIVENCFKHGFDQQLETAFIRLEAQLQEHEIVHINITDNGKGMNSEQVTRLERELLEQLPADTKQGESIGLKNIYDRLQIYYSHEAKMRITSDETNGFTVTIELPKLLNKEVHSS
jgi:two-component system sensor histidine kinase YesM